MLNQFRLHYPQGSLTSELLMIDHGLYIVRSLVKVENITLATGLAAAATIEAAEDQARLRALALLNFDANSSTAINAITSTPIESKQKAPTEPSPAKEQPLEEPSPSPLPKTVKTKKAPVPAPIPPVAVEMETVAETPAQIIAPSSLPDPFAQPQPPVTEATPELVLSESVPFSPEPEPFLSLVPEPTEQNGKLPLMDLAQTNGGVEASLSLETLPLIENPIPTQSSPIEPSQTVPMPTSPTLDLSEPIDFSEIIARSNIELKRLNWTNDQGKNYLLQTYGKRSRQLLSDEELIEFLHYLESQPTPPSA